MINRSMTTLVLVAMIMMTTFTSSQQGHQPKTPRIRNGRDALPGEVPWHVSQREDVETSVLMEPCTGIILSDRWVLTAGHCANMFIMHRDDVEGILTPHHLIYGTHQQFFTRQAGRVAKVDAVIVHPDFVNENDDALCNVDIALYHTAEPMVLDGINASAIPINLEDPKAGTVLQVAGFGDTEGGTTIVLRVARVTVMDRSECKGLFHQPVITDRMVCTAVKANGGGVPCPGDSGAGLVKLRTSPRDKDTLVAVHTIRSGAECTTEGTASGYVLVAPHLPWLRQVGVPV